MSANGHYDHFEPRWGFEYGAAHVTRMAYVEGRYHVLAVDTPYRHVQIGVSPTGRSVRVWMDGQEFALSVRSAEKP
jgi:hypothetical protein